MLNKGTYSIIKNEIERNELNENNIKNLNEDLSRLLIDLYIQKNYSSIQTELSSGKRFKKLLMKIVRDRLSYYIGMFTNTLTLFDLLTDLTKNTLTFHERMVVLYTKANVKKVAEYLLMNPDSQHKVIAKNTDIDKGYLSHILKELQEAGCVERYGIGKRSFFSLSAQGQEYVKKQQHFNQLTSYSSLISYDLFKNKYASISYKNTRYEDTKYTKFIYCTNPGNEMKSEIDSKEVEYAGVY